MTSYAKLVKSLAFAVFFSLLPVLQVPAANATGCAVYKIGYQGPLSGAQSATGIAQLSGVNLALSKFLEANPNVTNISATAKPIDDQAGANTYAAVASAIADDCLLGVVGPANYDSVPTSVKYYESKGIPFISFGLFYEYMKNYGSAMFNRAAITPDEYFTQIAFDSIDNSGNGKLAYFYSDEWEDEKPSFMNANYTLLDYAHRLMQIKPFRITTLAELESAISNAKAQGFEKILYHFSANKFDLAVSAQKIKAAGLQLIIAPSISVSQLESKLPNTNLEGAVLFAPELRFKDLNSTITSDQTIKSALGAPATFDAAYFLLTGFANGATTRAQLATYLRTNTFNGVSGPMGFNSKGDRIPGAVAKLQVSNGQLVTVNAAAAKVNGNLSVTSRLSTVDNFKFKGINWDGADLDYRAFIFGPNVAYPLFRESGQTFQTRLENGTNHVEVYRSYDPQSTAQSKQSYEVIVSGGLVTSVKNLGVNPATNISITGDTYLLRTAAQNTVITINSNEEDIDGVVRINSTNFSLEASTNLKKLPLNLDNSKIYEITYLPPSNAWKLAPETKISNVSLTGATPYQISLTPDLSNIYASITAWQKTGGTAVLLKDNGSGTFIQVGEERGIDYYTGKVGFKAAPGSKVKITFTPADQQLGPVTTPEYTVPASGILTMDPVTFSGLNVTGTISLSGGGFPVDAYLEIYKVIDLKDNFISSGYVAENGKYSFRASTIGTYKIVVNPSQNPDYKDTVLTCNVTDASIPTICDGTLEKFKVTGTLSYSPSETRSNSFIQAWPANNIYGGGQNAYVFPSTGTFGMDLEEGEYLLSANKNAYQNFNEDYKYYRYDKGYVKGCQVGSGPTVCNVSLVSNFNYTISDSKNQSLVGNSVATFTYRKDNSINLEVLKSNRTMIERFQLNSTESVSLPDGEHLLSIQKGINRQRSSLNLSTRSFFLVKINNGAVEWVRSLENDTLISTSNGTFNLSMKSPNFIGQVMDGNSPVSQGTVKITRLSNNSEEELYIDSQNPLLELSLPVGSYRIDVSPEFTSSTRATGRYVVTVNADGQITMTKNGDAVAISPVNGVFPLKFAQPNIVGKLTYGGSAQKAQILWRKSLEEGKGWSYEGWQYIDASGEIFGNFLPGKYRSQIYFYDSKSETDKMLLGPECVVPISGTVTCDIAVPNSSLRTTISSNNQILKIGVYSSIRTIESNDVVPYEVCCTYPNPNTGNFDFVLLDGKYELRFWQDKDGGNNTRSYEVEIKNQQVISFVDSKSKATIAPSSGIYNLSFLPANLSGAIKNSQGVALDFSKYGASINLEKWIDDKYWGGVKGTWISSANYEMRIDDPGKYRLYVSPQNLDVYSATYSSEFYVNANTEVSRAAGSGFQAVLNDFHVTLNSNNVLLKVLNPIDDKPLSNGYIHFYKKNQDGSKEYASGLGVWQSRNGLVGQYLVPGNYDFELNVWGSTQLFSRTFDLEIADTSTVTIKADGIAVPKDGDRFVIKPFTTNIKGRIGDTAGAVFGSFGNQYSHVNVQKYYEEGVRWDWAGYGAAVDGDGYFGLRIREPGKFRLVIEPQGNSAVAQTISSEFEITQSELQTFSKDFGLIKLNAPNFRIAVINGETGTALSNVYITMYKLSADPKGGKNYSKGLKSDNTGIASGYINEEGRYEFEVYPPWDNSIEGATKKIYTATVTKDANGNFVTTFDAVSGVSVVNGITRLQLGGSNLRGVVYRDDGVTPVANSQVLPYKLTADGEIAVWEYAVWTSSTGKWSMNLPAGMYKLKAQAPYGTNDQASSARSGIIQVAPNGNVISHPADKDPLNFSIKLTVPNWQGVLKAPTGDELITDASICINYRVSGGYGRGECFRVDSKGKFGFSIPDDAIFDSETSINFYDHTGKYPELRLSGKTQIESVLGVSGSGITVRLPAANIVLTVTGGGQPQKGVWLSVSRPGVEWVGGKSTDDQGVAGVYSSNLTDAFEVGIWVPTKASAINQEYVSTIKYYTASDVAANKVNGVFQSTIALPVPNIKGAIRTPVVGNNASELAVGAYINVLDSERGEWVPGVSVSADGTFALFLRGGCCTSKTYQLFVDPGYDKNGKRQGFIRKEYTVEVSTSNVATIKDKRTGAVVGTETMQGVQLNTIYLGTPNLTGVVVNPSNQAVPNSEVYAWGNCQDWWGCYQYTNQLGQFGLSLEDGDFTLGARTPWGNSEFADSERCVITVAGNSITNKSGNCIQNDGKAKISLRDPNFTFTLKEGNNPLRNAYVYLSIGGWGTQARTDQNGKVSILVNDQEIAANSQKYGSNTLTPYISVWMWGNEGDVIPWSCTAGQNKPICNQLSNYTIGTPFGTKALGDIQGATYNTRIKVTSPDNTKSIRNYAYVNIIRFDEGYDNWFGWGETNGEGWARFYLETTSALANAKFKVRVVPPYEHRNSMVEKIWDNSGAGYTLAELNNLQLALGTPNLKLAVTTAVGSGPNRWGWYSLEEWDSQTVSYKHVSGNGLDYGGLSAMNLLASKQYRLIAYPGGGRSGSATTCIINTDSQTVITLGTNLCIGGNLSNGTLNLQLARGNVIGKVLAPDGTTPIVGAIVYANRVDAVNEDTAVITCTLSDGSYGMTLDPNNQWQIKIFPANKATGPQYANKSDTPAITPQQNQTLTVNITLALK